MQAIQLDSNNISALLKFGIIQRAEYDYEDLIETHERVLSIYHKNADALPLAASKIWSW